MKSIFSDIYRIVNGSYNKEVTFLLIITIIGAILESLGVGMMVPILVLMSSPDVFLEYPYAKLVYEFLGKPSTEMMIVVSMLVMMGLYAFKAVFNIYLVWKQNKFSAQLRLDKSRQLFDGYMKKPYTFHLNRHSSELIRNITNDISHFSKSVTSVLQIFVDTLNFFVIFLILLLVDYLGTIIVFSLMSIFFLAFYRYTHKRMTQLGEKTRFHAKMTTKHLIQGLGGVKDVKLLGREGNFLKAFVVHNEGAASAHIKNMVISAITRPVFEFLAIVSLASLVISMIYRGTQVGYLIPVVGLFAVAAFRLIPSVSRIFGAIQQLKYCAPSVKNIAKELEEIEAYESLSANRNKYSEQSVIANWKYLKLKSVKYAYPESKDFMLDNVNVSIKRGSSVGFIGESGSGKSTLIDVILGLLTPSSGKVLIDKIDLNDVLHQWRSEIGYVSQNIFLTDDTLRRNVAFGVPDDQIDEDSVWGALESAQLDKFVESLENGLETQVGEQGVRLSGGQRQRIGIARALYHNPSIMVLDEATSALDFDTEKEVMSSINKFHGEKTILVIAHRLSTIENCDFFYCLDKGVVMEKERESISFVSP